MDIAQLELQTLDSLRSQAREANMAGFSKLKKDDLIMRLLQHNAEQQGHELRGGVLDIVEDGIGFLRSDHYLPGADDIYVSQTQIRRFGLRTGDKVIGQVRPPKDTEKYYGLLRVEAVNGVDPDVAKARPEFDHLTPVFPNARYNLEMGARTLSTRLINMIAPIGRGQRGLIVAPPRSGKTITLKEIANAISKNHPEVRLMVVLIGERPEEVTDIDRGVEAEVISATFDELATSQVRVAEMALERAKRLVEIKHHVVILLDSLTRLTRAYNLTVPVTGRTLSGGLDPGALYPAKHLFGAARNLEEGGSLSIIATCQVDTGSRIDDVIYEEFKGTANMELHLSRRLQERRIYPAFDIEKSSTRREELLSSPEMIQRVVAMRRMFGHMVAEPPNGSGMGMVGATEAVIERLRHTETNDEFLNTLDKM